MTKSNSKIKRSFTLQFKLSVIRAYERSGNLYQTAKRYKIDRAVIRRWIKNKNKLIQSKEKSNKKISTFIPFNFNNLRFVKIGFRKNLLAKTRCFFPELENQLDDDLTKLRNDGNLFMFSLKTIILNKA